MTAPLNGGSGKSTAPETTQNRCYPSDSEAAATGGDDSGNGFYLSPVRCGRCSDPHSAHCYRDGRPREGWRVSRFTGNGFCNAQHLSGGSAGSLQWCGCLGFEEAS